MPLRPGEVTRGDITPTLPVSTQRIAAANPAYQIRAPPTSRGAVIQVRIMFISELFFSYLFQGSGTPIDVLANRHAKRAPYRLPPTPPPPLLTTSGASSSRLGSVSAHTSAPRRGRSVRSTVPDGVWNVVTSAKRLFRLKILTVNAMWPDPTARLQAADQLKSARRTNGMESGKF